MPGAKKAKYRVCTFDIETDPFMYGRVPAPFCCGFFDGENYYEFWGDDCIKQYVEFMAEYPEPCRIYVHNGGGFDFWFLEPGINNPVFFINKRIAKAGFLGRHELRDSYRMIPIPLAAYAKESIDYRLMEREVRHKHKKKILHYLMMDCKYLHNMVTDFISRFGDHLTIGSASLKMMKKMHPGNLSVSPLWDEIFRPYYMGGRCEVFERGHISSSLKMYDVNSLYPSVMRDYIHPFNSGYISRKLGRLPDSHGIYFARIIADSKGALPLMKRSNSGAAMGLSFPHGENEFFACSHEILAAQKLGLLRVKQVLEYREFNESQKFDTYINWCMDGKLNAEAEGDTAGRTFYKLFANSGYGKWGSNPRAYTDCQLFDDFAEIEAANAAMKIKAIEELRYDSFFDAVVPPKFHIAGEFGDKILASRPADLKPYSFKNVAIAASITSAARAEMLKGIHSCKRPIYCDTDSLVCEEFYGDVHPTAVGAWKHEKDFSDFYVAGKKLYAAFSDGQCVKKASKGVELSGDEIRAIAVEGETIEVEMMAPALRASQPARFTKRKIAQTA